MAGKVSDEEDSAQGFFRGMVLRDELSAVFM